MLSLRSLLFLLVGVLAIAVVAIAVPREEAHGNPLTSFAAVRPSEEDTCALMAGGSVKCWGGNYSSVPANFATSATVVSLAASVTAFCAVETTTGVECWGGGAPAVTPTGWGSGIASVSPGTFHQCAVTTGGAVQCRGDNEYGQLGNGTTTYSATPVGVFGLSSGMMSVSAGHGAHTCALSAGGGVKCWGNNSVGQLGAPTGNCDGFESCSSTPVDVTGLSSGVAAVSIGRQFSCALTTGGVVKCWGLGYGPNPVTVAGLSSGIAQISAGVVNVCARTTGGAAKCLGENQFGQVGDGTTTARASAVNVLGLSSGVADLSIGAYHACATLTSGGAKCWGFNVAGQLGNGTTSGFDPNPIPMDVVVAAQKPTFTPTPCPPGGCPTNTPTATPPPLSVLDFSIGIDTNGDTVNDCGTRTGEAPKCAIAPGSLFQLRLFLNSLSPQMSAYGAFDASLRLAGVTATGFVEHDWPDCSFGFGPVFFSNEMHFGCAIGVNAPDSSYVGLLARAAFTCTASGSLVLVHGYPDNTYLVNSQALTHSETPGSEETLLINCVNPTPTPTPQPVGGLATDPASGDDASTWWLLFVVAGVAIGTVAAVRRVALRV